MIKNLESILSEGIHLVSFHASWCAPCKVMDPIINKFDSKINIIKIDTDKNPKIVFKYRIMSVPTILIFKDGKKISEYNGILSEEELGKIIKDISN